MFKRFNRASSKARNQNPRHFRSKKSNRSGVAAVECGLCLIVLTPIIFGTLEISAGYLAKQSLTVSAHEGARAGVRRGTTNADILAQTAQILEFRDISIGEASTTEFAQPGDQHGIFLITRGGLPVEELDALEPITVRIVAPTAGNATPIFKHMFNRDITASVTMVREFDKPIGN